MLKMDRYDYEKDRICGLDMHWYAVDQDGYIGEFWTCGELPIPGRISHNDLERIEYYADVLFNQEDLIKKPCGSRTKLAFYGYDDCHNTVTRDYPYGRVETPDKPMTIDELPEEIRQSLKIVLPVSFASYGKIPRWAFPDLIDFQNPSVAVEETPEQIKSAVEEGTRLWKQLQDRFSLRFEKKGEAYYFLRNDPGDSDPAGKTFGYKTWGIPFCSECYEKHGIIYPLTLEFISWDNEGKNAHLCKYCGTFFENLRTWQCTGDMPFSEPPKGVCAVETINRIPDVKNKQIRRTTRLLRLGRKGILYGVLFLFFLWIIGIFHPFVFYYLIFQPNRVYVDAEHLAYYQALDEGKAERNPDDPYERIIQGTWKLESPYSRPFDRYWFGWKKTRLHLYPDGRFELVSPIRDLDYLWEDEENTENRTGTWKPVYSLHYGYSICFDDDKEANSNLRYMMLWGTKSSNPMKRYKLCQTLDFPTDLIGAVWIKVSDHDEESK